MLAARRDCVRLFRPPPPDPRERRRHPCFGRISPFSAMTAYTITKRLFNKTALPANQRKRKNGYQAGRLPIRPFAFPAAVSRRRGHRFPSSPAGPEGTSTAVCVCLLPNAKAVGLRTQRLRFPQLFRLSFLHKKNNCRTARRHRPFLTGVQRHAPAYNRFSIMLRWTE